MHAHAKSVQNWSVPISVADALQVLQSQYCTLKTGFCNRAVGASAWPVSHLNISGFSCCKTSSNALRAELSMLGTWCSAQEPTSKSSSKKPRCLARYSKRCTYKQATACRSCRTLQRPQYPPALTFQVQSSEVSVVRHLTSSPDRLYLVSTIRD